MINSEVGKSILATAKGAKSVIQGNSIGQLGVNLFIGGAVSTLLATMD